MLAIVCLFAVVEFSLLSNHGIIMNPKEAEGIENTKRSFNVLLHRATDSESSTPSSSDSESPQSPLSSASFDTSAFPDLMNAKELKPLPILCRPCVQRVRYSRNRQAVGSNGPQAVCGLPVELQLAKARRNIGRSLSTLAKESKEGSKSLLGFRTLST